MFQLGARLVILGYTLVRLYAVEKTILNNYKIYNLVCKEMDIFNLGSDITCWMVQDKYLIRLVIRELLIA